MLRQLVVFAFFFGSAQAGRSAAPPKVPLFADRYVYAGCSSAEGPAFAVGDVNGDGIPDLVCTGYFNFGSVITFLGTSDGRFEAGPVSPVFYALSNPVLMDLNGDGVLDVVAVAQANLQQTFGIVVSFGNGDGTFQSGTFYQTGADRFQNCVVLGDFNGDGIIDAATLTYNDDLWLFTGRGDGVFNPGVIVPTNGTGGYGNQELVGADLNGDGRVDLVAGNTTGFAALLNNGDGTFLEIDTVSGLPRELSQFSVGDLNDDGRPDVLAIGVGNGHGIIFAGNGDGSFTAQRNLSIPSGAFWSAIADLNGDGIPDVVTSNDYTVVVNFQMRDGSFAAPVSYGVSDDMGGYYVAAADLRSNGRQDLIASDFDGGISVYLNEGKGVYQVGKDVAAAGGEASCLIAADFNGDGKSDLALNVGSGLSILLGTGEGSAPYTQGEVLAVDSPGCPVVGDINGDGIPDLIVSSGYAGGSGSAVVFLGHGDGTFVQVAQSVPLSTVGYGFAVGDFNADGKLDLASTSNLLALGNGDGTFQTPTPFVPQGQSGSYILAADLNGDKRKDILLTDGFSTVYVLINGGAKGFQQTAFNVFNQCNGGVIPALADLNGDGTPDLVLGCAILGQIPIYLNNGAGVFTLSSSLHYGFVDPGEYPLVTDVNGDGVPDIVVQGEYEIGIYLGLGSATFDAPFYLGTGASYQAFQMAATNAHGQPEHSGRSDLVVAGGDGVVLYRNGSK